ncbi:MAG: hypothetical protein ACRC32_24495 [Chroococcidiopsis sp.]
MSSSRNHGLIPCAKKHKTDFELRVSYQLSGSREQGAGSSYQGAGSREQGRV